MKKILIGSTSVIVGILMMAAPVLATTLSFSPSALQVSKGKSVSLSIVANPAGATDYTEKVELRYPADLLQVTSFNFTNAWMALAQPGYDSTDNVNGILVKTAGYPGGFSSPTAVGTVTFRALKVGSGTITVGGNSVAFQVSTQSVLTGSPVYANISAPIVVPIETPAIKATTTTTSSSSEGTSTQIAGVNASNVNFWIVILLVILIAETIAFVTYVTKQKKG